MKHDRDTPRPEVRALLAAVIWSPLDVATRLGENRWQAVQRELEAFFTARPGAAACRSFTGMYVCALREADAAVDTARAVLEYAEALGIPLQLAIHAGEVMVDDRELTGIPALAALHAAGLAKPGEILLTQVAAAMCRTMPADFAPAATWHPPGHSLAMRLYARTTDALTAVPAHAQASVVLPAAPVLSRREREVVLLVARGHSNREIATALNIAVGTVERHVANVLKKLQFRSRTQIARWAVEQGMIETVDIAS
jgi:DNA-binding NarL/FixJ family response regulator